MGNVISDVSNGINRTLANATDTIGITNYSGERALEAQRQATGDANQTMWNMYQQQRSDMEPWRAAGSTALNSLSNNDFMKNWQTDPGYQFNLSEGNRAINSAASARGLGNSGATLKALTKYGQDYASNEYQKVYDRNANRLSALAGYGSNASGTNSANAGAYGQGVANNIMGLGNAAAANQMSGVNRFANLLNTGMQAAGAYYGAK